MALKSVRAGSCAAAFLGYLGYKAMVKPAANFSATKIEKLTASGNVVNAAISRDGKYAAYIMDEVGSRGFWTNDVVLISDAR